MTKRKQTIAAIFVILLLGLFFHFKHINEFPSHIHAWAQSDRYALALGFQNNGFNFFKPETFVMNHQFPDDWKTPSKESITAVDFPIHDFITAFIMKITGIQAPWIFRLYILLYSFIGLFFLYKLAFLLTENFYKSIFVLIFAATSPVFIYYQSGFLPTIPSLANTIIGLYLYFKFLKIEKASCFNLSILFLTLAALSRATFVIPLVAVLGIEFIRIVRKKTGLKNKIIPVLISLSLFISYFFYNRWLGEKYGSIFLNHFLPAKSFQEIIYLLKITYESMSMQYFSIFHYIIFLFLLIAALFYKFFRKRKLQNSTHTLLFLTLLIFIGSMIFAEMMLWQFPVHDYYFLDTFYLPVNLLLIFILILLPNADSKKIRIIYAFSILLISIPFVVNGNYTQETRRIDDIGDKTTAAIQGYSDSQTFLDSIGIPKDSKMLVLAACSPNIPFILMGRKGYADISPAKQDIKNMLTWDYDYIVVQNDVFLTEIYSVYPEIISEITKIADNGKISVCKLSDKVQYQTITDFLGISNKKPDYQELITYDSVSNDSWQNIQSTTLKAYSGAKSGILTADMEYGLTFKSRHLPAITQKGCILVFSAYFLFEKQLNDCDIVVSIDENSRNTYYKRSNIKNLLSETGKWNKVELLFQLPQIKSEDYEFSIYIWNTGKNNFFTDDFSLKFY